MMKLHLKLFAAVCVTASALTVLTAHAQSANVTPSTAGVGGTNISSQLASASGLLQIPNDGRTLALIRGGGADVTATVVTQKTSLSKEGYGTITINDETVSIPSGSLVAIGPFPPGRFNTASGVVTVSMSSVTGVSVTAIKLPL